MGFFNKAPKSLLPPGAAKHLATFGMFEWDSQNTPLPDTDTTMFISKLSYGLEPQAAEVVAELNALGMSTGGWTVVGASYAARDFFPSQEDTQAFNDLRDARLRFVHDHVPNVKPHLATGDVYRYAQLFPDG